MAPLSTLCSVLTHSRVVSPRSHEFANCEGVIGHKCCRKRPINPNNAITLTFENMMSKWLLLPHCVQSYCIVGLIHPGTMSLWTVRGWLDINAVENGLRLRTVHSKRPLKTWWAMVPYTRLCSVLSHSWVDLPRSHEFAHCEGGGWLDINAVENGLKLRTVHSKRPLKTWWAMVPYTRLCSVLSRRWVDSPRKHVCVCGVFNINAVVNGLKTTNNAIKTTLESTIGNGSSYHTVFSPIA